MIVYTSGTIRTIRKCTLRVEYMSF